MSKIRYIVMLSIIVSLVTACSSKTLGETLASKEKETKTAMSFVIENVELQFYERDGWPYLHSSVTNNTKKDIASVLYCMLAYDKEGQPLKLQWHIADSSDKASYDCVEELEQEIGAGETFDKPGGWSLYDGEKMTGWPKIGDGGPNQVVYGLYCAKQITFLDGSVWENPDYDTWLETYRAKEVPVETLEGYYPFVQELLE